MAPTQDSAGAGSILPRNYGLVLEDKSEQSRGGNKIYWPPYDFLLSPVLLTAGSTLQNQWGLEDDELEELEQAVKKKEGSMNLIRTPHYRAILGEVEDKSSLPAANNQYLEGAVKSKSRGWYDTTVESPYLLRYGGGDLKLLLNDMRCQCGSSVHEAKSGGGWTTIVACPHSAALWSDLNDFLSRSEDEHPRKQGWKVEEALDYELFVPFTFMEDRDPDQELAVLAERYLEDKKLYEINRDLLAESDILTQETRQLIEQGDLKFELLQQKRKKSDLSAKEKQDKEKTSVKIHRALRDAGLEMTGKYLEEGLPAERYEDREGNLAAGVIYAERDQLEPEYAGEASLPILVATKLLGEEVEVAGNEDRINPYAYVGSTWTRIDDRTRRRSKVRYSTPNRIGWPAGVREEIELELPASVIRKSKEGIEDYAKNEKYSLRQAFGLR